MSQVREPLSSFYGHASGIEFFKSVSSLSVLVQLIPLTQAQDLAVITAEFHVIRPDLAHRILSE